jgi:hypothetical protein
MRSSNDNKITDGRGRSGKKRRRREEEEEEQWKKERELRTRSKTVVG